MTGFASVHRYPPRGVALFMVIGLITVFIPVLFFLSQMGGSQVKQASKYRENLLTESVALSGSNSGISRLRGALTGLQQFNRLLVGDQEYDLTIRPTGTGMVSQRLYYLFSRSQIGKHNYVLMSDAEQFPPDPSPPLTVLTHDYWNTLEPYDITNLADITSMENYRGQDLLWLEDTRNFEKSKTKAAYGTELLAKRDLGLPGELMSDWSDIVTILQEDKLAE